MIRGELVDSQVVGDGGDMILKGVVLLGMGIGWNGQDGDFHFVILLLFQFSSLILNSIHC